MYPDIMALSATAATDVICNSADEPDLTVKINEVLVDGGTPGTMTSIKTIPTITTTDQRCDTNAEEPDLTAKSNEVLVDESTPGTMTSIKTIPTTTTTDQQSGTNAEEPDLTAKSNEVLVDEATPDTMTSNTIPTITTTDQHSGTNVDEPDLTAKTNGGLLNKDTPDTMTVLKTIPTTEQRCGTNVKELDLTAKINKIMFNKKKPNMVTLNRTTTIKTEQQYDTNANNQFVTRCLRVYTINDGAQTKLEVDLCGIRWKLVEALGTIISLLQRLDTIPVTTTNQHGVELPVMMNLQVNTNNDDTIHLEVNLCGSRQQLLRSLGATISLIQKLR